MNTSRASIYVLTCAALLACTNTLRRDPALETQGDDRSQARAQLLATIRAAETRARNGPFVEVLAALFDSSGAYLTPGPVTTGPAGVRSWLERDSLNARSTATWRVVNSGVSADGRDGFTYGYFDIARASGDSALGRFQAYWRRNSRGEWRILAFTRGRREVGPTTSEVPDFVARGVGAPPAQLRDSNLVIQEIKKTEAEFADSVGASVARAFKHFAAPNAGKFAGPSKFVFGPDAIETIFTSLPPGAGPAWEPQAGSVAASQDLGFTYGPAWNRQAPRPAEVPGKYFTIWQRQPDGTWRYVVD